MIPSFMSVSHLMPPLPGTSSHSRAQTPQRAYAIACTLLLFGDAARQLEACMGRLAHHRITSSRAAPV